MKINSLDDIIAFLLVYQERSFTAAAGKMKISKAALSNRILSLEEKSGILLFKRSTRNVIPTQEAQIFYKYALKLQDSLRDLENSLDSSNSMEGKIHITCPNSVANSFLGKKIIQFMQLYPDIQIELSVTDSYLDLIENNIDLAIRIGNLPSSSLHGRKIGTNKIILACSPEYKKKHGTPSTIEELKKHKLAFLDLHEKIQFKNSKIKLSELSKYRPLISNHSSLINQFALEGNGIAIRSDWDLKYHLNIGQLIEISLDDELEDYGSVWLLSTSGRLENYRVKIFFNFITQQWKEI